MNIIERYKEYKSLTNPVNIVVNSEFDYKSHELNVLKECLNCWSKEDKYGVPIKFNWIYTDPEFKQKLYFVSTNLKQLKKMKLDKIVNETLSSVSYMTSEIKTNIFPIIYKNQIL